MDNLSFLTKTRFYRNAWNTVKDVVTTTDIVYGALGLLFVGGIVSSLVFAGKEKTHLKETETTSQYPIARTRPVTETTITGRPLTRLEPGGSFALEYEGNPLLCQAEISLRARYPNSMIPIVEAESNDLEGEITLTGEMKTFKAGRMFSFSELHTEEYHFKSR